MEIDASGKWWPPVSWTAHTTWSAAPRAWPDYDMRLGGASYAEIAAAGGGILSSVRAVRETPIRKLVLQARRSLGGFIRHGTTTLEAKIRLWPR